MRTQRGREEYTTIRAAVSWERTLVWAVHA
nr:MAG TPA: hypothetical protein [Caudoviricetes sp.]